MVVLGMLDRAAPRSRLQGKIETSKCFLEAPSLKWLVGCALVAWLWWKWLGGGDSWVWGVAAVAGAGGRCGARAGAAAVAAAVLVWVGC